MVIPLCQAGLCLSNVGQLEKAIRGEGVCS